MTRLLLAALLATSDLAAAAHAQSRPMPAYQDDETYGRRTASDDHASSGDARHDDGYPRGYGDPPMPRREDRPSGSTRYDVPPPSDYGGEDEAHLADRMRTAELNHRASARPGSVAAAQGDYARQSAQYRAELADHERAMRDYGGERARYAERVAHWRARADACEAGDVNACNGPE